MMIAAFQDDNGLESRVWARTDGQFAVSLADLDSGETASLVMIFPATAQAAAIAHAKTLVPTNGS